jgi:hypothetical protein
MKRSLIPGIVILSLLTFAKDKKKSLLPDLVLQARTVMVIVDPDSGVSLTNPGENTTARNDVTSALEKWGRFSPTLDENFADLIIVLHKGGRAVKPTIGGVPSEAPGTVWSRDQDVNVRIGGAPPLGSDERRGTGGPTGQTEISKGEDVFAVYLGKTENPLDASPIWRYSASDGLQHPAVPAVDKFHKAIEQAEKAKK